MARRTVYWHIGPDDLGTAFLAHALDVRRDELAAAGVLVPGAAGTWERVGAELRRDHERLGLTRAEVEGQTAGLVRRIWRHKGVTVLSTPALAPASRDEVALALDGLRGAEIHLVLVVRDLTSQVYAGAQAALEGGATTRPTTYAERVLHREDHPQAVAYRAGHDLPDVLRRWARTVLPEHVHVIAESDPALIWGRLMDLVGAEVDLPAPSGPLQLGPAQLAVLREVAVALDDQLDARGRRTALRDELSRTLLPAGGGAFEPLDTGSTADEWTDQMTKSGFDLQGTISRTPITPVGEPVTPEVSLTTALADALVEVARLRQANDELVEENTRLDRLRRKHKRRARRLSEEQGAA